ncbi:hypothetical protein LH399_10535 [Fusobacterium nucleatum]
MLDLKKNKVIFLIFLFSLSPIILNFFFFITDISAGKEVKCGEIFYSSISNENWLDFWGTFMPALAAFSFLYFTKKQTESIKKQLEFEKNKYKKDKNIEGFERNIGLELSELKATKKIVYDFLAELDIPDIGFSIANINNYGKKIKKINIKLTAVDILTSIRLGDTGKEINKEDEQSIRIEECKNNGYKMLTILHKLYCAYLEMSFYKKEYNEKILKILNEIRELENEKKYKLEDLTNVDITEEYNNFYNKTLNILLEYFYLREDKIKYQRMVVYNKEKDKQE